MEKDIKLGRASAPVEISSVDLSANLLTTTFGIWERRSASEWKTRVISNFRSNTANDFAWLTNKLQYDNFEQLREALGTVKSHWPNEVQVEKSDFEGAFKTLPAASAQAWLSYALVFNPSSRTITSHPYPLSVIRVAGGGDGVA